MSSGIHIEEFLFRGRPEGSDLPVSWHVVLGESGVKFGKPFLQLYGPMTPEEASEAGFPLETILSGIGSDALIDADRSKAALAEAIKRAEAAEGLARDAEATIETLQRDLSRATDAASVLARRLEDEQAKSKALAEELAQASAAPAPAESHDQRENA